MKTTRSQFIALASMLLIAPAGAQELFSVNFFGYGRQNSGDPWTQEDVRASVRMDGEKSGGIWETTAWQDIGPNTEFPGPGTDATPPTPRVYPITADDGVSTATLTITRNRLAQPYLFVPARDSDTWDDPNASLLEGTLLGSNRNADANPRDRRVMFEISDIPFAAYDMILYFSHSGQWSVAGAPGGLANLRYNEQIASDPEDWTGGIQIRVTHHPDQIQNVEPDGTLRQIEGDGDAGNYMVIEGLSGDFRAEFWGAPDNQIGISGFQIRSAEAPPFGLTIQKATAPATGFDLEWESQEGKLYNLLTRADLSAPIPTWEILQGDIEATPPANLFNVQADGPVRFYAVEEFDAPPPPPLLEENFEDVAGPAPPDGWTRTDNGAGTVWEVGTPAGGADFVPSAAAVGTQCAGTNINAQYTANADASLISPAFTVPETGATLAYWQYIDTEPSPSGDVGSIRLLNASDDSFLTDVVAGIEGITTTWSQQSVDLPEAANGLEVKLEFRFTSNDSENWGGFYIDDIVVTAK